MVNINIVSRCFAVNSVPSFVRVNSMLSNEFDVRLVKSKQFGWKGEYRHTVDPLVTVKPPTGSTVVIATLWFVSSLCNTDAHTKTKNQYRSHVINLKNMSGRITQ